MDIQNILSLSPEKIDNDLKDDLYNYISFLDIDTLSLDRSKLRILIKITQEVLKYKGEQVDSLISEFDELAMKQGEEEAKRIQYYENEIKSLKSSGSRQKSPMYDQEIQELKIKIKNQKINMKIQKEEIQRLTKEIMMLQEENNQLQVELASGHQGDSDSQSISESQVLRDQTMIENIRQKNKQISHLLTDIENTEKENIMLQENITSMRNELSVATESVSQTAAEIKALKITLKENDDVIINLKQQNEAFQNQIQELVNEKQYRESQLDDFSIVLDAKVEDLKKLLEEKQLEIDELQSQIMDLKKKIPTTPSETLLKLAQKEEEIEELQSKLIQATKEIENSSSLLEKLMEEKSQPCSHEDDSAVVNDLKQQLATAHERCQELQQQATSAEQDAQNQGQQLTDLIVQLRKYEDGQYGLSDALQEVQKYRKQIHIRDKQISKLVQDSNKLQAVCDKLEQDNYVLRDKLNLPPEAPIVTSGIISKQYKQKKLINNLQNKLELNEDEKIKFKVMLRKYKYHISNLEEQISKLGYEPVTMEDPSESPKRKTKIEKDDSEFEKKFNEAVEENEALRKGMHEILDNIRTKNDSSTYDVKSEILEKLVQMLDVRHVSGWYHPAMRYQAEVNTLKGVNDELRNQLKETRLELNLSVEQLHSAEITIDDLQKQLNNLPISSPEKTEDLLKSENEKQDAAQKETVEEFEPIKESTITCKDCKKHIKDKESWIQKYEETSSSMNVLEKTIGELQNKMADVCNTLEISNKENSASKIAEDFITTHRKCVFLKDNEKKITTDNTNLKNELVILEATLANKIKNHEIIQNDLSFKISTLENTIKNSVPNEKFDELNKKFCDLMVKYREVLNNEEILLRDTYDVTELKKDIELLTSEKNQLNNELLQLKTIKYTQENQNNDLEVLSKQLATMELKELSERQRADHTNNLYELVKEQLNKSEERCKEIDNQNKVLIGSNLKLQITQQELEDKLVNCYTKDEFTTIKRRLQEVMEQLNLLKTEYEHLKNRNNILEIEVKNKEMIKNRYDYEFLSLKHLVLDLQASSEDKAVIARLGTDLVLSRICETESKNKVDILKKEIEDMNEKYKEKEKLLNEKNIELNNLTASYDKKYRLFAELIEFLRKQYLGCIPLTTQERYSDLLRQSFNDNKTAYKELREIQKQKNDLIIQEENLKIETKNMLELKSLLSSQEEYNNIKENISAWNEEKNSLQLSEMRLRRNFELRDTQFEQALQRLKKQDIQISEMEEELLYVNNNVMNLSSTFGDIKIEKKTKFIETKNIGLDPCFDIKIPMITKEIQTIPLPVIPNNNSKNEELISSLQEDIKQYEKQIVTKDTNLREQCKLITDLEKNLESLRLQLIEKENQILQQSSSTTTEPTNNRQQINIIDEIDLEEHNKLKRLVNNLQVLVTQKEDAILRYEKMIKDLRDEHSLAASRFQEEIKELQFSILQKQQIPVQKEVSHKLIQTTLEPFQNKAAIEKYISQVHALEGHMCELETSVSSLKSQLQSSREEAVRWKNLAIDRLNTINELRKEFDGNHAEEISSYKEECEKYKSDNNALKQEISKLRIDMNHRETIISQKLQEKESKIHELNMTILQLQNNLKINTDDIESQITPRISELELAKNLLQSECDALKKRYNQLLTREKNAREEIRTLKGQLIKRPFLPGRNDRNDKGYKENLQKKVASLAKELSECQEKLEKEMSLNESRKLKTAEDFALWEKQKKWQQTAEKLKEKLNAKCEEYDKLQQNFTSAKTIVNKLEREKHILENKLKVVRSTGSTVSFNRLETLELENARLQGEIEILKSKLEMHQHHSGGLGVTLLQEKLEAQERKIAILEVTAKGSVEVVAELERLNSQINNLQKTNLRLEAENLELRLDLEKAGSDTPYLKEQIQHLERYMEVLRAERDEHHVVTNSGDQLRPSESGKRVTELEKTVLSLRRLVEKLQAENKRLQSRPCTTIDKKMPDKVLDVKKLKEQYGDNVQKCARLEDELERCQKRVKFLENIQGAKRDEYTEEIVTELANVKAQLTHKTQLLDKVKMLLQKAASKERVLQEQVTRLKLLIPNGALSTDSTSDRGMSRLGD